MMTIFMCVSVSFIGLFYWASAFDASNLGFIVSDKGQEIVKEEGFVPAH